MSSVKAQFAMYRWMQCAIRRQNCRGIQADRSPAQVCEHATRLSDNYRQGRHVEDVHVCFDHDVESASREQVVVHKVAVATNAADLLYQSTVTGPSGCAREAFEVPA